VARRTNRHPRGGRGGREGGEAWKRSRGHSDEGEGKAAESVAEGVKRVFEAHGPLALVWVLGDVMRAMRDIDDNLLYHLPPELDARELDTDEFHELSFAVTQTIHDLEATTEDWRAIALAISTFPDNPLPPQSYDLDDEDYDEDDEG